MFETRRKKLNKCIAELNEYNCVLWNVTNKKYDNEKAKKDVANFFEQFLKIPPDKEYKEGKLGNHYSYLGTLLKMKIRLINEEYPEFCHELITLHHYENLLQRRIFFNIVKLYNIFIEVNNESDNKNI